MSADLLEKFFISVFIVIMLFYILMECVELYSKKKNILTKFYSLLHMQHYAMDIVF